MLELIAPKLDVNHLTQSISLYLAVFIAAWQSVRKDLSHHQHKRNQQRHFRCSPTTYLANLEQKLLQLVLPL